MNMFVPIILIVTLTVSFIALIALWRVVYVVLDVSRAVKVVHEQLNSRLSDLLELTKTSSFAAGQKDEKNRAIR